MARKLDPMDIVSAVKGNIELGSGEDLQGQNNFVAQTIAWLVDTRYLILRQGGTNKRYVLSPRAFEAMNAPLPNALVPKGEPRTQSLGEKLAEVSSEMGREVGKEAKKQMAARLVGEVIGWAWKTASS